jgi:hypothetical protein
MTATLVYGPQTDRIEALLRAVREMTPTEIIAVRVAAWAAAWDAAWDGAWDAAWDSALGAVTALVVLDLVGRHGLAREHIDTLAAPILTVLPHLAYLFEVG